MSVVWSSAVCGALRLYSILSEHELKGCGVNRPAKTGAFGTISGAVVLSSRLAARTARRISAGILEQPSRS